MRRKHKVDSLFVQLTQYITLVLAIVKVLFSRDGAHLLDPLIVHRVALLIVVDSEAGVLSLSNANADIFLDGIIELLLRHVEVGLEDLDLVSGDLLRESDLRS